MAIPGILDLSRDDIPKQHQLNDGYPKQDDHGARVPEYVGKLFLTNPSNWFIRSIYNYFFKSA